MSTEELLVTGALFTVVLLFVLGYADGLSYRESVIGSIAYGVIYVLIGIVTISVAVAVIVACRQVARILLNLG